MSKTLGIAVVGAGLWWAHREGYLDGAIDQLGVGDLLGGGGDTVAPDTAPASPFVITDHPVSEPLGVVTSPATGEGEGNAHVQMLRKYEAELSPWSRKNIYWTAAMCMRENHTMNPLIIGGSGEYGVMQVMPTTAPDIYRYGYKKYEPTAEVLQTFEGGIYYGTSYLDWIARQSSDLEWITRSYNGGTGWQHHGKEEQYARSLSMTAAYYAGVLDNFRKIREGG